jgi:hypothetical protein
MLEALFWIAIGFIVTMFIRGIIEGGGEIAIRNSDKYKKYQKEANEKVKELLRNTEGSTKEELMEWWNTYHKKR